jgi:hypothetical protein
VLAPIAIGRYQWAHKPFVDSNGFYFFNHHNIGSLSFTEKKQKLILGRKKEMNFKTLLAKLNQ